MKLTADLCARAIIAAAHAYGDDPVRAVMADRGVGRRCLPPTAYALADVCGLPRIRAAAILRVSSKHLGTAKKKGGERFQAAFDAAYDALQAAPVLRFAAKPLPSPKLSARLAAIPISSGPSAPYTPAASPIPRPPQRVSVQPRRRVDDYAAEVASNATSTADRALIEAAIASGKVSKMPDAVAEGALVVGLKLKDQPEPLTTDWRSGPPTRAPMEGARK